MTLEYYFSLVSPVVLFGSRRVRTHRVRAMTRQFFISRSNSAPSSRPPAVFRSESGIRYGRIIV